MYAGFLRSRAAALLILTLACQDSPNAPEVPVPGPVPVPIAERLAPELLVSNSIEEHLYVSMRPGSLADADSVVLWYGRSPDIASLIDVTLVNGGFDPVRIRGYAGDTIRLRARVAGRTTILFNIAPQRRPPAVVRTFPQSSQVGVDLNTKMVVVFSEPMASDLLSGVAVQLRTGTAVVETTRQFKTPVILELQPTEPLESGTTYGLHVSSTTTDESGEPIDVELRSLFETVPATHGTLAIRTITTGEDLDPDGYVVSMDGKFDLNHPIGINSTTSVALPIGVHEIVFSGVHDHCQVLGAASRMIEIKPKEVVSVTYEVICEAWHGALTLNTVSVGQDVDPDGYVMSIGSAALQLGHTDAIVSVVGSNEVVQSVLPAGMHGVELTGVAANCRILGEPRRIVEIKVKETTNVTFNVVCETIVRSDVLDRLVGKWKADKWEFFSRSDFTGLLEDVIAGGMSGTLKIERTGPASFRWEWRETYRWWGPDRPTIVRGSATILGNVIRSVVDTYETEFECDWGDCEGPLHGDYNLAFDGVDRLVITRPDPVGYYLAMGPYTAWSRLTLSKLP